MTIVNVVKHTVLVSITMYVLKMDLTAVFVMDMILHRKYASFPSGA